MIEQLDYMDLIKLGVSSLATLMGVFLSWYLKYKYGEYKQKKMYKEITNSKLIQTILDQLLIDYNCQRAFILQKHNGGKYNSGKSIVKLSTSFESLEEGVSTEFKEYQNLPITLYSTFVENVIAYRGTYLSVDSVDDVITRAFFTQRGTKSAIVYPIKKSSEVIAMLGFEWTHTEDDLAKSINEIEKKLKSTCDTLSKLL